MIRRCGKVGTRGVEIDEDRLQPGDRIHVGRVSAGASGVKVGEGDRDLSTGFGQIGQGMPSTILVQEARIRSRAPASAMRTSSIDAGPQNGIGCGEFCRRRLRLRSIDGQDAGESGEAGFEAAVVSV